MKKITRILTREMPDTTTSGNEDELMPIQVFVVIYAVACGIVMICAIGCWIYAMRECALNSRKIRIIPKNPGHRIVPKEVIVDLPE